MALMASWNSLTEDSLIMLWGVYLVSNCSMENFMYVDIPGGDESYKMMLVTTTECSASIVSIVRH